MINNIINTFKGLDKLIKLIMKNGLLFCLILSLTSIALLITYMLFFTFPIIYTIGLSLFKLSMVFSSEFIICGLIVDKIKKQLI